MFLNNILILILVASQCTLFGVATPTGTKNSAKGQVNLSWKAEQDKITFTAVGQTAGWVSVGLSNSGLGHSGTDSCTAWVLNGTPVIVDGYSNSVSQPVIDQTNDCQLIEATDDGTTTTIKFSRPLTLNNADDVSITNADITVIVSVGAADGDAAGTTFPQHGGGVYETFSVNLLDANAVASGPAITLNPGQGVALTVSVICGLYAAVKWGRRFAKNSRQATMVQFQRPNQGGMVQRFTNRVSQMFSNANQGVNQGVNRMSRMMGFGGGQQPGVGPPSQFMARPMQMADGPSVSGQNGGLPSFRIGSPRNQAPNPYQYQRNNNNNFMPRTVRVARGDTAVATKLTPKTVTSKDVNNLRSFLQQRMFGSQVSMGDTLIGAAFFIVNMGWLLYGSPNTDLNSLATGLGHLCSPSMVFVALPATRNSLLTLALQMPFEETIMFHRWLGRWLMIICTLHMLYYYVIWIGQGTFFTNFMIPKYLMGYIGWFFLLVLYMSSLGPVRRLHYNTFKYLHFSFFGFYIFGVIHSGTIFNYAIAAGVFYGFDRLIRLYLGLKVLTAFEVVALEGDVIRIRFAKHSGREYEAGQYVFLKIPLISKTEWHPYTLSSGPHEDFAEVHIKSLGDHTSKLLNAIRSGSSVPTVRVDGPYGKLSLNYERYETVILIGGGVGVTPMVSILKDIYQLNMSPEAMQKHPRSPWIKRVYLSWTVPSEDEWRWFSTIINEALAKSNESGSTFPQLTVYASLTKGGTKRPLSTMHTEGERFFIRNGRPDLNQIFQSVQSDAAAQGSSNGHRAAVYACGPAKMVNDAWDLSKKNTGNNSRFDFHHEVFDF